MYKGSIEVIGSTFWKNRRTLRRLKELRLQIKIAAINQILIFRYNEKIVS